MTTSLQDEAVLESISEAKRPHRSLQHYGTVFLPTKPYTPQHKGKVESGIKYVKNNALAGRVFDGLEQQNAHLLDWEQYTADTRIHGTTKRQVGRHF